MNHQQRVRERRQWKTAIRRHEDDEADDRRERLQDPREVIMRPDRRPDEHRAEENQERGVRARHAMSMADFAMWRRASARRKGGLKPVSTSTSSSTISSSAPSRPTVAPRTIRW